jgi:hypothetical protein
MGCAGMTGCSWPGVKFKTCSEEPYRVGVGQQLPGLSLSSYSTFFKGQHFCLFLNRRYDP